MPAGARMNSVACSAKSSALLRFDYLTFDADAAERLWRYMQDSKQEPKPAPAAARTPPRSEASALLWAPLQGSLPANNVPAIVPGFDAGSSFFSFAPAAAPVSALPVLSLPKKKRALSGYQLFCKAFSEHKVTLNLAAAGSGDSVDRRRCLCDSHGMACASRNTLHVRSLTR